MILRKTFQKYRISHSSYFYKILNTRVPLQTLVFCRKVEILGKKRAHDDSINSEKPVSVVLHLIKTNKKVYIMKINSLNLSLQQLQAESKNQSNRRFNQKPRRLLRIRNLPSGRQNRCRDQRML